MSTKETVPAAKTERKGVFVTKSGQKLGKPRNYDLGSGIYRFSRSRMFHKKAIYKFLGKKVAPTKKVVKSLTTVKKIDGEKNGVTRQVLLKKRRNYYATQDKLKKRPSKKSFKQHTRKLRHTLTPGTVCILLAGRHKGKHVILLKQLHSGLLLVTGTFVINACPLRRIEPIHVLATRTKIDISKVTLPPYINDEYFSRKKKPVEGEKKKEESDIFTKKKEVYKVSKERKDDQKLVDKQVTEAIKQREDKKLVFAYLASMFGLRSSQYPHRMNF